MKQDKQPGKPVEWPVHSEDIGGELLAILSKGLYTNPLDCIREYVQNAVDARAKNVTIKITGNSVVIFDDGQGMSLEELAQARQFGISPKSLREHVGFRGIGIYSGFDLCNRLVITTKKANDAHSHILEFDFGAMKGQLERERQAVQDHRTSLTELLTTYSHFVQEKDNLNRSYTMLQLEDISDTHIDRLSDRTRLRKYVLLNLPIDFDDDFEHKEAINDYIGKHVKGYNAIKITLESDSEPREVVCRPAVPNLRKPELGLIHNAKNELIGCYWACLNQGGNKIPDQYADYRGFVYRVKGFTIGDNLRLQDHFKKGNSALYWWYMGEIFVRDHNVIPNAARDDFEASLAKEQLEIQVKKALSHLEATASDYQQEGRAHTVIERSESQLQACEEKIASQRYDSYEMYSELDKLVQALEAQKRNANAEQRQRADSLLQRAKKLQQVVSNKTEDASLHSKKPKKSSKQASPPSLPLLSIEQREDSVNTVQAVEFLPIAPVSESYIAPLTEPRPTRTLIQLFESAGWYVTEDCARLIQVIDASFSDVLVCGSDTYQKLLDDIEAKLNNGVLSE
jgi:hypothetical protein